MAAVIGALVASIAVLALIGSWKRPARPQAAKQTVSVAPPSEATKSPSTPTSEPPRAPRPAPRHGEQLTIPYRGVDPSTKKILVQVTLNGSTKAIMALDPAVQSMQIAEPLAEHLGLLRPDEGKLLTSASGVHGATPAMLVVLDSLALGSAREEVVPAAVTAPLSNHYEGLLGQDFISTFDVQIDTAQQVLVLTKPESTTSTPAGHDEQWWRHAFRQFKHQRQRWEVFREQADRRLVDSPTAARATIERFRRMRAIADHQLQEMAKLENRLEQHAAKSAVPREWR